MRNVAWASSPCLKFSSSILYSLFLLFCAVPANTKAQDEPGDLPAPEALPLESYTFAMHLPPNTVCSVTMKGENSADKKAADKKSKAADPFSMRRNPVKIERFFQKDLCVVREGYADGSDAFFYFANGVCAFDDPQKGMNVRHQEEGRKYSEMDTYHFPELLWAGPQMRKENKNDLGVHLYEDPARNLKLEVDAGSKRPLRFHKGSQEWTYTYKESSSPLAIPGNFSEALKRAAGKAEAQENTEVPEAAVTEPNQ